MSFVHPALLFGTLLFAVPLVIHLLNRQRFKRRDWAAMEFLLAAYKKTRRRLRTENLLLLLLRCLIPIVIALAIARPVLRDSVGPALGGTAHHVLVLDQSYSMGLQPESAESPFQNMKNLAGQLVDRLANKAGNKVTLVLAGMRTSMPVREDLNLRRAKAEVASLSGPQDVAVDLTDALGQVADLVEEEHDSDAVVYVFTDMQARAFGRLQPAQAPPKANEPSAPPAPELFADTARDQLQRIRSHAELVLVDTASIAHDAGPARYDNLQIVDFKLNTTLAVARQAVPVVATVRNLTDTARNVQVTLDVEGDRPTVKSVQVEAGAEGQVEFLLTFRETGLRHLRVSLDGDGLAADNERYLVLRVRDRLRLLLVEGSTEQDPALMETELLRSRLDPTRGEGPAAVTTFAPKVVDTIAFLSGREQLDDYDVVVLANIERLNDTAANALRRAMLGGTGLFVMLGNRTDPASFNLHLGGDGPMPLQLLEPIGFEPLGERYYESEITKPDHPIFRQGFVEEVYYEFFQLTPVYRLMSSKLVEPSGEDAAQRDVQVLARTRDRDLSPLLVTSRFGQGKAVFLTSALSDRPDRWNRFDTPVMSFPLSHEIIKWLALPATDVHNVETGGELTATLRQRPSDVAVLVPERAGGGKELVGEEPAALPGGLYALPAYRRTAFAGIYTVELNLGSSGDAETLRLPFAANVDPAEGELRYLSHRAAREQLGVETILRRLPAAGGGAIHSGRADFGLPLLYMALLALVGEGLLARFVARRRS